MLRLKFRGYVHVRRGLFISRKKYNHFCLKSMFYSKTQNSEIYTQDNDITSHVAITDASGKDAILRNASEMRLRDFLNCFYVSGWVPFHLMKDCVSDFSTTEQSNNELGSILLKCSGHTLATCENKTRLNITNAVWKTFSRGTGLCHDQYHILLNIDAENCFYRSEVLSEMNKRGLQPNQTTYELLLQSASESNNKVAFNDIKTLMERDNATLSKNFYSSLIRIHTWNKDLKEIQDIDTTFRGSEHEPSVTVAFALLRAYASLSQYNLLVGLVEEMISSGQDLKSNQLVQVIAELSHKGPKDKVVQFVNHIHSLGLRMAVKDVNWLTAYLTSRQLEDIAYQLLSTMSWEDVPDIHMDSPPATLVSLMCAFWNKGKKPEALLKILGSVESVMRIPWAMETALHGALRERNSESAWIVVEEMHKKAKTLRPHYFWPLLLDTTCPKEIFHILKKMFEFGVTPDTATLKSFVIERLLPRGVDALYLGDRLVNIGVRTKEVILAFDIYFLESDQMDLALQRALRPRFEGSTELVEALTRAYLRTQDDQSMVSFLRILRSDKVTKTDWVGQILVDVYTKSPLMGERLLESMRSGGLRVSTDLTVLIKVLREQARMEPQAGINDIKGYDESGNWPRLFSGTYLHPKQMNLQELENHLAELRSKGMNTRTVLRKLFLMHCNKRNIKRAKELFDDLQETPDMEWSAAMLTSKMHLHAMLGDAEQSLKTYFEIKTKFPKFHIDVYKTMALAESLVRDDRLVDALNILKDLPVCTYGRSNDLTSFLVLVETFSKKKISIDDLYEVINLLISKEYVAPSNPLMSFCIDFYIRRDDYEGAVKEFQNLNQRYGLCPNKFKLLSALHTAKLKGKLNNFDKLRNAVVSILKQNPSYHLLDELLPAAEAGDRQEVFSVMSRILEGSSWRLLDWQCRHWATTNNISPLELILSAAQELKSKEIDMSAVVLAIADEYYYQGDKKKLSQLFKMISQREISVSAKVHRCVDKLSRSCDGLSTGEDKRNSKDLKNSPLSAVIS